NPGSTDRDTAIAQCCPGHRRWRPDRRRSDGRPASACAGGSVSGGCETARWVARASHRRTGLCALPARQPNAGLAHFPHRSAVVPAAVRSMSATSMPVAPALRLARAVPYPERHTRPRGVVEDHLRAAAALLLPGPPQALRRFGARRVARLAAGYASEANPDTPETAPASLRVRLRGGISRDAAAR